MKIINRIDWKLMLERMFDSISEFGGYLKFFLVFGGLYFCLIIAASINLYYPSDWTIEKELLRGSLYGTIYLLLLFLGFGSFLIGLLNRYRFSKWQYLIFGYGVLIYAFLRFDFLETKRIILISFSDSFDVKFLDIPFLLLAVLLTISVLRDFFPLVKENNVNEYIEDSPVTLSHKEHPKFLTELNPILFNDQYEGSFSIGVIGAWGTGKSSFIKAVEEEINSHRNSRKGRVIYLRFSPFLNHNESQIIQDFFSQLSGQLKKYSGRLSSKIIDYADKLSKVALRGNSSLADLVDLKKIIEPRSSIAELYEEIRVIIDDLSLRIIISVDDIDRLSAGEIMEVLKLIRNTSNFPNTIFLVAMDKEYVIGSLGNERNYAKKEYLEKFFQLELYLPTIESTNLVKEFLHLFENNITNDTIINSELASVIEERGSLFSYFIRNYRDVKRIINQLKIEFKLITENANTMELTIADFFYITILKIKFPSIFMRLSDFEDRSILMRTDDKNYSIIPVENNRTDDQLTINPTTDRISDDVVFNSLLRKWEIFKEGVDFAIIDGKEYDARVGILLVRLFGKTKMNDPKDITSQVNFRNYFYSSYGKYNISEAQYLRILNIDLENDPNSVKEIDPRTEDLASLMSRMEYYEPRSEDDAKKYVRLMRYLWIRDCKNNSQNDKTLTLFLKHLEYYAGYIGGDQITNYIEVNVLKNKLVSANSKVAFFFYLPSFLKSILKAPLRNSTKIFLDLYEEELTKLSVNWKVQDHEIYRIYHRIKGELDQEIINEMFIKYLKKSKLISFLYQIVEDSDPFISGKYIISSFVKDVFGTYQNFYKFIDNHEDSIKGETKEFLDFSELFIINRYRETGFQFVSFRAPKFQVQYEKGNYLENVRTVYLKIHDYDLAKTLSDVDALVELEDNGGSIANQMNLSKKGNDNLFLVFNYQINADDHLKLFLEKLEWHLDSHWEGDFRKKQDISNFSLGNLFIDIDKDGDEFPLISIRSIQPSFKT